MDNVINGNFPNSNKPQQNDVGDLVVRAEEFLRRFKGDAKYFYFGIFVLLLLASGCAFVEYSNAFEIVKIRFEDSVLGGIAPESETVLRITAMLGVAGFFYMGRLWLRQYRMRAALIYCTVIVLLSTVLNRLWGSDINALVFGNVHIGLTATPNHQSSMADAIRWLYLIGISIFFTLAGLAFAYIEMCIEKRYSALKEWEQNVTECQAIIKTYNAEKQRLDEQEQDKALVDFYTDPNNIILLAQLLTRIYLESYKESLSTEKNNLSQPNRFMSSSSRNNLFAKMTQIDQLLSQADTLTIP